MNGYQGKKHDYLGMWLDFLSKGEVKVSAEDWLRKMIYEFPEEIKGLDSTPSTENLFKVRDNDTRKLLHGMKKI